jgi:hypothetical protein
MRAEPQDNRNGRPGGLPAVAAVYQIGGRDGARPSHETYFFHTA